MNSRFFDFDQRVRVRSGEDVSGTPFGLLDLARSTNRLGLLFDKDSLDEENVLIEYPFSEQAAQQTGFRRFLRLRKPVPAAGPGEVQGEYSLILTDPIAEGATLPQDGTGTRQKVYAEDV